MQSVKSGSRVNHLTGGFGQGGVRFFWLRGLNHQPNKVGGVPISGNALLTTTK